VPAGVVRRINNCVGEDNQWAFMQLVAYAYILSLMTLVLDVMQLYFLPPCVSCDKARATLNHLLTLCCCHFAVQFFAW